VPRGTERLRITPTPWHTDKHMDALVDALAEAWDRFDVGARTSPSSEERIRVG